MGDISKIVQIVNGKLETVITNTQSKEEVAIVLLSLDNQILDIQTDIADLQARLISLQNRRAELDGLVKQLPNVIAKI